MAQTLKNLEWEPMHDTVYLNLCEAIMRAHFQPGEKLSLRKLAGELGVSVMPVRAAILRLVAEKAVAQEKNGTFVIPKLSRAQFQEILELRMELEGRAAGLAAQHRSLSQLTKIEKQCQVLSKSGDAGQGANYVNAIGNFKFAVLDAANAPVLRDLVESLWMRIGPFMSQYASDIALQRQDDRHEQVTAAIRAGDVDMAAQEMRNDIRLGMDYLIAKLDD